MKNPSPDRVATEEGVVVGQAGGRDLKVDVYVPPAPVANGAGVLLVHGGGWQSGDRSQLRGYGILLGRVGYTCVACEYRLSGEAKWPAQIEDVRTAFGWMRNHASDLAIERDRIAVEGNSAGAHLAMVLAGTAAPGDIAACVAIYGPADLTRNAPHSARWEALRAAGEQNSASLLFAGMPSDEVRAEASPITYASSSYPPAMLIHGNKDELVDVEHSLRMYRALVDAGAKAELHVFEGQPHAFERESRFGRQCAALMTLFLDTHIKGAPAAAK